MGVKAQYDTCYNMVTERFSIEKCEGFIVKEFDLKNDTYRGEKVF